MGKQCFARRSFGKLLLLTIAGIHQSKFCSKIDKPIPRIFSMNGWTDSAHMGPMHRIVKSENRGFRIRIPTSRKRAIALLAIARKAS